MGYQSSDSSSAVREAQELLGDSTEELLSVLTAVQIHPRLLPPPRPVAGLCAAAGRVVLRGALDAP